MTVLGIDFTSSESIKDWTGLVSGHRRPLIVEQAHDASIAAWAEYIAAADIPATIEELTALREAAFRADVQYDAIYNTWMTSLQECTCDPRTELSCPPCCARHALTGDEMPY